MSAIEKIEDALTLAIELAKVNAETIHSQYAGYKPHKHKAADEEVKTIEDGIAALAELKQEQLRDAVNVCEQKPAAWCWMEGGQRMNGNEYEADQWVEFSLEKPDGEKYELTPLYASPQPPAQRRRFEFTEEMKLAFEKAAQTGDTVTQLADGTTIFINRGEQLEDTSDLNCPYCGGSGHRDDVKVQP